MGSLWLGNNGLSMDSAITYLVYLINIFSDKIQLSVISSKYNKRIITPKGRYHPRILKWYYDLQNM